MNTATQQLLNTNTSSEKERDRPLIFFDGVCGLCNASVDFLLKHDQDATFRFAPLQGETAQQRLAQHDIEHLDSVILQQDEKTYRHSTAVTRMLWQLGGWWRIAGAILWLVPWPIRHLGYKAVAARRYASFGKKSSCRLPTADEQNRFLP